MRRSTRLGAAFEILRRGHYEQPSNEGRSRLFSRAEWKTLSVELNRVCEAVGTREGWADLGARLDSLKEKVAGLNAVSGTRLNQQLLDDLKLAHGEIEECALRSRNDAAHGSAMSPRERPDSPA